MYIYIYIYIYIFSYYDIINVTKKYRIQEPQNISTEELLNTISRYDSRGKVKNNNKKLSEIKLEKWLKCKIFQKMK